MNDAFDQMLGYVRDIWRRWTLVLIIAWVVSISGWVWVYILENQYQAQARVFVDTQSLLRPLLTGLAVQPDVSQQVKMMTRTLMSRPNLEKVARMTDMDIHAKTAKQQEEMYKDIESRVSLAGTERENLYTISYRHANPYLLKRVVQAFLTFFGRHCHALSGPHCYFRHPAAAFHQRGVRAGDLHGTGCLRG